MTQNAFTTFPPAPRCCPLEVLEASAKALVDYQGKGFGIAECSHRGKEFDGVLDEAIALCRKLLDVPDTHDILFLQGGATQLFSTIPMNFLTGPADYVVGVNGRRRPPTRPRAPTATRSGSSARSEATHFDRPPRPSPRTRPRPTCTSARTRPCTGTGWPSGRTTRTWWSTPAPR